LSLTTKKLRASDTFAKEKENVTLPVLKNMTQSKSVERSTERKAPPVQIKHITGKNETIEEDIREDLPTTTVRPKPSPKLDKTVEQKEL